MLHNILRVDVVDDRISVGLGTRREDHDVEVLAQLGQNLLGVGPDLDITESHPALVAPEGNLDFVVGGGRLVCVNQGLIHVENYCLFAFFKPKIPAVSGFIFYSAALLFAFWHTL